MKKWPFILSLVLLISLAFTGCTLPGTASNAPYNQEYVLMVNGSVETNESGEMRVYQFTSSGVVFQTITVVIVYKHLGQEPSSSINATCSLNENVYSLSWGMWLFEKTEVWEFDSTANRFTKQGEEEGTIKLLVPVSSLTPNDNAQQTT